MDTLRFITAGSVDDGKSTLIGRLLYDSKSLLQDQVQALKKNSGGELDFASLTDGLRAEREQGITIDVAYRYFSTPRRRFIIADTPGHVQYVRNMVTGASNAALALLLVDASRGVSEQTLRHAYFASLLGIKHLVVCVNKMDLVEFSKSAFDAVRSRFEEVRDSLAFNTFHFIPISALHGDNLVTLSDKFPWYKGPALLPFLEEVKVSEPEGEKARFPVQWVVKDNRSANGTRNFRGYAGQIYSGTLKVGDEVVVTPARVKTRIKEIHTFDGQLKSASHPLSVTLLLEDELDVGRGDIIVHEGTEPRIDSKLTATVCWMQERPLQVGQFYQIKHAAKFVRIKVTDISSRLQLEDLKHAGNDDKQLRLNDIGTVSFIATTPIAYDFYNENKLTGSFVIIDEQTNATAGAGLLVPSENELDEARIIGQSLVQLLGPRS